MGALLDAMKEEALVVAQRYARAGLPVFPCNPLNKHPLTEHGHKDATTDLMKIRGWWAKWPLAMVGAPMGAASGMFVLDVDNDPSRGKYGIQSLADIGHEISELMDGPAAQSASGGLHFFYRYDPAKPVSNARGKLPKWVDVRGEGGYVVLAGSKTSDGRSYAWLNPLDETEATEAPEWLMELLHGSSEPLDFNGAVRVKAPAERVAAIAPGTWHENTRDLVARMVREGASDETIEALALRFVEPGFTVEQTTREFLTHAHTARAKWGYQPKDLQAEAQALSEDVFRVLSIDDLANLKPPEWRIDGIFTTFGSSTIYGAYESYKTFVALDMLLNLAVGRDWMGRKTKPCAVLYIVGEGQHGVAQRILGWCHAKNDGVRPGNFFILPEAVALPIPGSLDKLLRTIDRLPIKPDVIALDTITRMSGGGSLNDEKDMQKYVMGMDRLRLHVAGHVMNIGHSGKDKEKGLLGSIVLPAAMETIICVERKGDALKLVNSNPKGKQKDGPNFEDILMRTQKVDFEQLGLASSTLILMPDDKVISDHEAEPTQRLGSLETKILAALGRAATDGQGLRFMRLKFMTDQPQDSSLNKALQRLANEKGLIEKRGEEWVLL